MMRKGQCFALYEGNKRECYFFTGITESDNKGIITLVMCRMLLPEQITINDFMKITEADYYSKVSNGQIEEF